MSGCELPVIINSGSGNQGITASVPVVVYAEAGREPRDALPGAGGLNLSTIHIKAHQDVFGLLGAVSPVRRGGGHHLPLWRRV